MSRAPNLRPGGLPDVRPGDRWLVRLRGSDRPLPCRVLSRRWRGRWRVAIEGGLGRVEVGHHAFVERLPPAPPPTIEGELAAHMRILHRELRRLADLVERLSANPHRNDH